MLCQNLRLYSMKYVTFKEIRIRKMRKEMVVARISLGVNGENNQNLISIILILAHVQMSTSRIRIKFRNFITWVKFSVKWQLHNTCRQKIIVSLLVNNLRLIFIVLTLLKPNMTTKLPCNPLILRRMESNQKLYLWLKNYSLVYGYKIQCQIMNNISTYSILTTKKYGPSTLTSLFLPLIFASWCLQQ